MPFLVQLPNLVGAVFDEDFTAEEFPRWVTNDRFQVNVGDSGHILPYYVRCNRRTILIFRRKNFHRIDSFSLALRFLPPARKSSFSCSSLVKPK